MNEEQLRDILPPMLLPEEPNYLLFVGAALLVVILLAFLFWFFMRKKSVVLPNPCAIAMGELMRLRSLMAQDKGARYAQKLSDVLRAYIENRFQIPTGKQTTKEFFRELQNKPTATVLEFKEHGESLKACLDQCDMAKFAKLVPDQHSMKELESAVQHFIEATPIPANKEGGK